mgnify:CR=1 FL=1
MSIPWSLDGEYAEACSCHFLCPCITLNSTTPATEAFCKVAMTFRIEHGHFAAVPLDGLAFAVVAETPPVMSRGNWRLGVIVDERASLAQQQALTRIASGQAGGPPARFAQLTGEFLGVERAPIAFSIEAGRRRVHIPGRLDQLVEGVPSRSRPGDFLAIDNTVHAANPRLMLALALKNVIRCFGIDWLDEGRAEPRRNGHFAQFSWQGEAV